MHGHICKIYTYMYLLGGGRGTETVMFGGVPI